MGKKLIIFVFFQASKRTGILNPRILFANHALATGPAFYDMAHGLNCFPLYLILRLKVSGNRQSFAFFTLSSTISQRKLNGFCSL